MFSISTVVLPMAPGRVVGGKYELVQKLGCGAMGEVWSARHRTLGGQVAIKLLARSAELAGIEDEANASARFHFEACTAARLSRGTKHIIRVTDHGVEGPHSYLVMELLEGQPLETLLMRRGPVEPALLALFLQQVARALDHAHAEGVVHRDLKPANIFITRDEFGAPLVISSTSGSRARSVCPPPRCRSRRRQT